MITPKPINVHLNIFEGPMDLLLHLIKKDNLDVAEINVSEITKQYLEYLNVMKELNLEIAGEFLVMASTLMQIKAKSLLPSQVPTGENEGLKSSLFLFEFHMHFLQKKALPWESLFFISLQTPERPGTSP